MNGVAARTAQYYSKTASCYHWIVAFPLLGTIGTVLKSQQVPKEEKGIWIFRHKSLGLLTGMLVAPRLAYRLVSAGTSYNVVHLPGVAAWEKTASSATHYMLYAFMTIMPATGIAMGYYGGKGLPFFYTTIEGAAKSNGAIAKNAFDIHKQVGIYGKYLVPVHVGAAFMHYFRGQAIFTRINPLRAPKA